LLWWLGNGERLRSGKMGINQGLDKKP
jgi:hypothetical protein